MNDRELMQQALYALEYASDMTKPEDMSGCGCPICVTIPALRERLAQPKQEPVAWMVYTRDGQSVYVTDNPTDIQENQRALPMYTTPPQRKPLTNNEIRAILDNPNIAERHEGSWLVLPYSFTRAIEAAHGIKEKNT